MPVVLHPSFTWSWIRKAWADRTDWITAGERAVLSLWREYSVVSIPTSSPAMCAVKSKKVHENNDIFNLSDGESDSEPLPAASDVYSIYAAIQRRISGITRPLDWWSSVGVQQRYPRLSQMAIDLFTIPAMSDEPERTFSSTGLMVTPHRSRLSPEIIGQAQCLKSWQQQGIISLGYTFSKSSALSSSGFSNDSS